MGTPGLTFWSDPSKPKKSAFFWDVLVGHLDVLGFFMLHIFFLGKNNASVLWVTFPYFFAYG